MERLKELGIVSYLPALHREIRFFFANSKMTMEELQAVDGVEQVEVPPLGKLNSQSMKSVFDEGI